MNAAKTAIIVDSGCDVSKEFVDRYDMKVLSLKVLYGSDMYNDGVDIDPLTVYERFPEEVPTTSTPNIQDVIDMAESIKAEGYDKIIAITISSGLSSTFNNISISFREVEGIESFVFDTKNISIGAGLFAIYAGQLLEEGKSFDEVVETLQKKIYDSKVFFYMDTLDYLRKGGRINPAVAIVGKALNLKPIISCNEKGVYYTVAKMRGSSKGIDKLLNVAMDFAGEDKCYIALMNGKADEAAAEVKPLIEAASPKSEIIVEKQITATMAVHTGPGLVGIGVLKL